MKREVPGRGPRVRAAVLASTIAELAETGCDALTVENVARRAGVHKTTVYRRWPDRVTLVVDAMTDLVAKDVPIPDTGSVESDLRELARLLVRWLQEPMGRALVAVVVSETGRTSELAEVKRRFYLDRFRRAEPVVARAVQRGELPEGTDAAEVIKALIAPIYLRLLVTAERIDQRTADRAAEVALAAARAGVLGPARRRR